MWLEEYRVDGLRWDMTAYIRNIFGNDNESDPDLPAGWDLMRWVNDELNNQAPGKISIAEDLKSNPWLTKDTGAGGAGFDAQWAADFIHPVRQVLIVTDDQQRDIYAVGNAINHRYNDDAFERVIYTESHDEVANGRARLPEDIHPGSADSWYAKKRSTLGAALVFTSPGIPMLFQGQEFLEDEWFRDQDPIDWSKREKFAGILELYRDLITLRRNKYGFTTGWRGLRTRCRRSPTTQPRC
jgi:1,4-alpha-glucan branching enzyme